MIFCGRPFEHMYVKKNGDIQCCSWAKFLSLGNIVDNSLEDIWHGEMYEKIRGSILDQSYQYCDKISCPLLSNNSLPDLDQSEILKKVEEMPAYPVEFNLAYDFVCNHACPSCRDDIFKPTKEYRESIVKIESNILPYLKNAKLIMASGNGDIFASKTMLDMLSKIEPENSECILKLETNGALVQQQWKHIEQFERYNLKVVVTPNSFEKETYSVLSGGIDNLEDIFNNLRFLRDLRKSNRIKEFKITMVVQDTNFREIPNFIERSLNEFEVDLVQLRPIMPWFKLSKDEYIKKNLLSPSHPLHNEFIEVMSHDICYHPKVYHWSGLSFKRENI